MKSLVEKLKTDLAEKERKQKALMRALAELRQELLVSAEQVPATAERGRSQTDVQKIVDRETKSLQTKISELESLVEEFPELARLYSLGQTHEGRDLAVIQLSQGVHEDRVLLKPMIKLIANMHGNEAVGREMLLSLSSFLLRNYGADPRVTAVLDTTDLHILPSLNPDGFEASTKGVCRGYQLGTGRHNGNNVDLNRAFPSWDDLSETSEALMNRSEPEVAAVIDWVLSQPFVLSANFHDGAVVANYPYDDSHQRNGIKSLTPDDSTFVSLSRLYASNHRTMHQGTGLCDQDNFPEGITNGAEWYVVKGGMQDFNYLFSNCMEITVELSCCKYPLEDTLQGHWEDNREALLAYVEAVQAGLRGIVRDAEGEPVANAIIEVAGIEKNVTTSFRGEFWRLLSAGRYCVRATSEDEALATAWVEVRLGDLGSREAVRVDFTLSSDKTDSDSDYCRDHDDDDDDGVTAVPVTGNTGSGSSSLLHFSSIVIFSLILSRSCT